MNTNLKARHFVAGVIRMGTFEKFLLGIFALLFMVSPIGDSSRIGNATLSSFSSYSKLLGVYPKGWINDKLIYDQLILLDRWTGKQTSIVGIFSDIEEDPQFLPGQLDLLWRNGYTALINLQAGYFNKPSAYDIASGKYDSAIARWASRYAAWAVNGKWAYIAILPEMNVPYSSYARDPGNYKLAFAHIQDIFEAKQVPETGVRWVFAPHGSVQLPFEAYYPGDDRVDIVGFSAFNNGKCDKYHEWVAPMDVLRFSISELHSLAPTKPVFITRLGTTAYFTSNQIKDVAAKNQWLSEAYAFLSSLPNVRAVLYYNYPPSNSCDWEIYNKASGVQYEGYKEGVELPAYGYLSPAALGNTDLPPPTYPKSLYFPVVLNQQSITVSGLPVMLGTYPQNWAGSQTVINDEFHSLDAWAGKRLSIAGVFLDMLSDPTTVVEMTLEPLWDNGYLPFVNLTTQYDDKTITAKRFADGVYDKQIRAVAQAFARYAGGGEHMAYLAPLQEMNGDWVPYGADPANFKKAYLRIQWLFQEEGVPASSARWVFAPNGSSSPGDPPFEDYYPGDDVVDFVGFTSYHFGYCIAVDPKVRIWDTQEHIYGQFLVRMHALAPTKPIFITQTGTTAMNKYGKDVAAKNQWLSDAYNYLAAFPEVRGIIYYNRWDSDCDWAFYHKNVEQYDGYIQGVANPVYGYVSNEQLKYIDPTIP